MKPHIPPALLARSSRRHRNRPALEIFESRTLLTTVIDVTTFDDVVNPADGLISLREAVSLANTSEDPDAVINLQAGTYLIALAGSGEDDNATGDFDVYKTLQIVGQDLDVTIINANDLDRIFDVHAGTRFTMTNLSLYNGFVRGGGGGIRTLVPVTLTNVLFSGNEARAAGSFDHTANGGGLYIREPGIIHDGVFGIESLPQSFLHDCLFLSNFSDNVGGGVCIERHDVTIEDSRFAENRSDFASGGAIHQGIAGVDQAGRGPGRLTLSGTTLEDNRANDNGGGINFFSDNLNIASSRIINNNANSGGGIFIEVGGGSFTIDSSTISGNSADEIANGLYLSAEGGDLVITNSTIANNTGARYKGGGLYLYTGARVDITNSTISGNSCGEYGGGIFTRYSVVQLFHVTMTLNTAANGGGIYIDPLDTLETWAITTNSIIAGNSAAQAPDIFGQIDSRSGHNLLGPMDGWSYRPGSVTTGDLVGVDPMLAPLADNGGTTLTHNLLPGSPAIDAAANVEGWLSPDQRGVERPQPPGGLGDIGAVEYLGTILDNTPPTVGGIMRYGYHNLPTTLVVMFSEPMDTRTVINTDNYVLLAHLRHHRGQIVGKRIPIAELVYEPQLNAVAIRPGKRLPLHQRYQITLLSGGESGLRDLAGNPLDGNANGIGGDHYVRIFGNEIWQKPVDGRPATPVVTIPVDQLETPALPRPKFRVPKR
jgi:hypothetical protein